MSENETAEADESGRGCFEKSILRNSKRFSSVFERIYLKYNREFENDEPGGRELTNEDLLDLKEGEKEEEEETGRCTRGCSYIGKQLSSYHLLDDVSSESEDDSELTALLHQRVVIAKKEICWEEEEQRDRERSQLKMAAVRHTHVTSSSSSESEESDSEGERPSRRTFSRRRTGRREKESSPVGRGDGSETLYETEYLSEYDPAHVQSEPEENGCFTPRRCVVDREAYSTPRVTHRRRLSLLRRSSVIRELGKKLSVPIDDPVDPNPDDGIISGYDTASGYHSGPGEHVARRNSSESDTLEYVGTPDFSPSPMQDILCVPPPVSPSLFDKDISISLQYKEETSQTPQDTGKGDANPKGAGFNSSLPEVMGDGLGNVKCTCDSEEEVFDNCKGVPLCSERSHDESCDHFSVVNNVYTNITYISYGCGHTVSMNRPSCFHCYSGQYYDSCCPHLRPQYHYPHPPHYHTAPPSQHTPHCKAEHRSSAVTELVDPHFNLSVPNNKQVAPIMTKRKLDSELSDLLDNGTAPLAKKHCH